MSHVTVSEDLLPLVGNITNDICSVDHYDFSLANSSYEARVQAVTKVASICYGNPKALGSISLFDRLQAEAAGLPSSSYEFVPVLLSVPHLVGVLNTKLNTHLETKTKAVQTKAVIKFGEYVHTDKGAYLLTNLRALIADVGPEESLNYLNTTPEEIQIIKDNFKVFLFNVDLSTRAQMVRHRCSWQELSRRYVSGKKQPFEFYISEKMKGLESEHEDYYMDGMSDFETDFTNTHSTEKLIEMCLEHYYQALEKGVKPEEARRILPQAMMTRIWGAFQPAQLANFFTLRLDKSAQREIRTVAEAMKELI